MCIRDRVQTTQQQKQRKISGVVKDAMGEAIIGASVIEKGNPTNGTITNIDGEFTLNTAGKELQVTYIGYIPVSYTHLDVYKRQAPSLSSNASTRL